MNQGLNGGNVLSLMEHGSLILAGTNKAGVFISVNNGDSWASSNKGMPRDPVVTSLAEIGNTIFAGLYFGGVYRSTDNGNTWESLATSPFQISSLYVSGNNLFAGSTNGLSMSSDNGNTWISRNSGLPSNPWINTIRATSTSLIVGTFYKGTYRSNDNGATWQVLSGLPVDANVQSLAVDNGKIFAGVTNSGIYISIDNGDSWTSLGGFPLEIIYSLSYIGNTLYAGTFNSGLYKSTNNGSSWSSMNLGRTNTVSCIIPQGANIVVGTSDGIYRSSNSGSTWSTANNNLTAIPINSISASGSKVLAGAQFTNGLFISNDQASTWSSVFLPKSSTNGNNSLAYIKNDTLIGYQGRLTKLSTNAGVSWSDYAFDDTYSLLINKGDVFRGTYRGLFVYKKNGNGWNLITNGINTDQWISSLAKVGTTMFAGTIIGQGVLRSSDDGLTWSPANNGLGSTLPTIAGVYSSTNKLFAVTNSNSFYYSTDLGNTWTLHTQIFTGFINDITFSDGVGFMANSNGVMYSLNNGETWVDSGNDFPSHLSSYSVSCNAENIFTGTSAGVLKIALSSFYPTLSSFSPTSGKAGTAVTIEGTNFTSPEFLIVKFNGVLAQVITSTSTKIIVNVPSDATTGPITVEINGHPATSLQNFCLPPNKPSVTLDLADPLNSRLVSSSLNGNQWFFNEAILPGAMSQTLVPSNAGSYTVQVTLDGCSSLASDVFCFNIPKPTISSDFTDPTKPTLTSSSDIGNQWFLDGVKINDANTKIYSPDKSGSFSVNTTNFGCTSQLSDAVAVVVTGDFTKVENLAASLTVYPSPANSFIMIGLENFKNGQITLTIYDVLGRQLKSAYDVTNNIHAENVSDFPSGVYLIKVNQLDKTYQTRFVKN